MEAKDPKFNLKALVSNCKTICQKFDYDKIEKNDNKIKLYKFISNDSYQNIMERTHKLKFI